MRRQVVERGRIMQQMNEEAFAACAWAHYTGPGSAHGDAEKAIVEEYRLGSDRVDRYTMCEGEKLFRKWVAGKLA